VTVCVIPMAFRQHNKDSETTRRKTSPDELLRNGMPDSVVDDERRWIYVLLHGADEFGSGWDPTWVTKEQAENLLALLRLQYTNPVGLHLLTALEKRTNAK
jgi:hypothetical protein